MNDTALTINPDLEVIEQVVIAGDLSKLTPGQRVNYYRSVCESIGLNPLTKPFEYIMLNGKLTLYARKDATDQLRKINGVSIGKPDITFQDDLIIVAVGAHDKSGREDSDIGVVRKGDMRGDVANALMKAVTKAKRRVTLSLCGLGWLDETEVEAIPDAKPVKVDEHGEVGLEWTEPIVTEQDDDRLGRLADAQAAKQTPPTTSSGNGKPPKLAILKTPNFQKLVEAVNAKTGHYKTPDHMRAAAVSKLNYAEITDKNLKAVTNALVQYGVEQDALKNAPAEKETTK